jgi:hypothetical protein
MAAAIRHARATLRARCDTSAERWRLAVLEVGYADPIAKTEDGMRATPRPSPSTEQRDDLVGAETGAGRQWHSVAGV